MNKSAIKMNDIKKVAVLYGGDGAEREVSLASGSAIAEAVAALNYDAALIDLRSLADVNGLGGKGFDFAFIAMHGDWGEDGTLQAMLDALHIPYSGSRPSSCRAAMHKETALRIFKKAGLRIPKGVVLSKDSAIEHDLLMKELGERVIVKPCSGGSTVGVTIVPPQDDISKAVKTAMLYDSEVLVEEFIEGRELTTAVLVKDGRLCALPAIEIVPHEGFFDYQHKYTSGASEYIVPAPLDAEVATEISQAAVTAHKSLGCKAYSRSDFRLSDDGVLYILETNTAPGMTGTSLVPKAAAAAGITFQRLIKTIISASR